MLIKNDNLKKMDNHENKKNKINFDKEEIGISNNNQFNIGIKNLTNFTSQNISLFPLSDNSYEEDVTISPIKLMITSASSKITMIAPSCKLEKFLPPLNILNQDKKTLVLDLDETLIHSYFDHPPPRAPDISFDIIIEKKKIHVSSILRPGVQEFLDNLEKLYEIVVFTASLSQYANPVLDFIDKKGICKYRLFREHCCCYTNGFGNSFIKDLNKLDRDMKKIIIIDNNPKSFMMNKENGIPIKTWIEDLNDRELYKLLPYLIFLGNQKVLDVRTFLKEINSGNSLNYEQFDKMILEYNNKKEKELEDELNKINIEKINQNIFDSINNNVDIIKNNKDNTKIKENKVKKLFDNSNNKDNKKIKSFINKENKENKNVKNEINKKINDKKNIIIENNKEIKNKIESAKSEKNKMNNKSEVKNNNIVQSNKNLKKENKNNNSENIVKKENKKNILQNSVNLNMESSNNIKRNNSVNNKENILRKTKNNNKKEEKRNINVRYNHSLKEEDLLLDEYNLYDEKNVNNYIQREIKDNIKINKENNTSREDIAISLNKIKNDKNNFFLKKNSYINTYKNSQIRNESDLKTFQLSNYNQSNKLLNEFIKNLNKYSCLDSSIKINKSIQFSEQEKTIINDDLFEEEKNINNENNSDEQLFDVIETEKDESKIEKSKSFDKEKIKDVENIEDKKKFNTIKVEEVLNKKKRKINKNLFNKGKIYKYQLVTKKDKNISNMLFINRNHKKEPVTDNPEYMPKKKFSKEIFNFSKRKKDQIQNNISSSNYKLFKEKEKPILFLKNKSNINHEAINLFISKTKSLSKHKSNLFSLQSQLNGTKTNKNKLYMINKEQEGLRIFDKNKDNNNILFKGIALTKRPTSCVNKNYEGINNNNKLEKNKKIIRFTKQDKKIYLKTNKGKIDELKKAQINLDNINNMEINLDKSLKIENEESKDDNIGNKKGRKNVLKEQQSNSPPNRNVITDIFFVKNLEERNNSNKKTNNEIFQMNDSKEKKKLIQYYNKGLLL